MAAVLNGGSLLRGSKFAPRRLVQRVITITMAHSNIVTSATEAQQV
jgi:hypothetical protein